jgi:hypothetical protein
MITSDDYRDALTLYALRKKELEAAQEAMTRAENRIKEVLMVEDLYFPSPVRSMHIEDRERVAGHQAGILVSFGGGFEPGDEFRAGIEGQEIDLAQGTGKSKCEALGDLVRIHWLKFGMVRFPYEKDPEWRW